MSDDTPLSGRPHFTSWLAPLLALALGAAAVWYRVQLETLRHEMDAEISSLRSEANQTQAQLRGEIEDLKKAAARREAEVFARSEELRQRETSIAGREDAAVERTQSSFQGLMIQQQLTKTLEALKASLPDMTPEVERLAREHAQFDAERQRLQRENAELRRRLNASAPLEAR